MTEKVIDVINNNDPDMMIKIYSRNPDGELVEVFNGIVKDIPDNLNYCEVLGIGFFDCSFIHIKELEKFDDVSETASTDEPETEEATPEVTAPVETEHSDDVPETVSASYPLDVPFDMRIKHLCRICKHLEKCFYSERSKVLEYYANHEYCGDLCGDCTLCCSKFESIHIETIQVPESYDDGDLPF
ncbi:MAG: hypothetical protein NC244_09525 [Alistipes senegalensis]|nr:hypothetical protein [Alistipes senegalensis]